MFLPDINFWLALAFESHAHHVAAKAWLDRVEVGPLLFCRFTPQGFLRIGTDPKAFGSEAATLQQAWGLYDAFLSDNRIGFSVEPTEVERDWRKLTHGISVSAKVWSDAYLAAFAIAGGLEVVTFDRDFQAFAGVRVTTLSLK